MSVIGEFIKQEREAANISQRKLSDAVGISSSEMMKIENGSRKNPPWQTLCRIAKILKIHPFEIMIAAGYISKEEINPSSKITDIDKLSNDEIGKVQLFVDFIISQKSLKCSLQKEKK